MPSPLNDRTRPFWKQLPWHGKLLLLLAIFFTFSTIGVLQDVTTVAPQRPYWAVIVQVVFAGLCAIGYAYTSMRDIRWIPLVLGFQIAGAIGISRLVRTFGNAVPSSDLVRTADLEARLSIDVVIAIALIALGYTFFILTIVREGSRFARLRAEVDLAGEVQRRLVPRLEHRDERAECYGLSLPSSAVGGDLVDALPHHDGSVAYVADVAGHGIPAGTLMGMVKIAARMSLGDSRDLGDALTSIHRALFHLREPERFVTFAAVRLERSGEAEVAIAGHLPILHVRASGGVERIANEHLPLGVLETHVYTSRRVGCASGDLFAIVSDGLTEAMDARGDQLGLEPLEIIARAHRNAPLPDLASRLLEAARGRGVREDDQTLLLMRVL